MHEFRPELMCVCVCECVCMCVGVCGCGCLQSNRINQNKGSLDACFGRERSQTKILTNTPLGYVLCGLLFLDND